jgi:hypothetical protein
LKDAILRLCLRAYPSIIRERDGRAIIDLARDLSGESRLSFLREAGGMLWGGIRKRSKLLRLDLAGAPWHAARERLALPLAVGMLCLIVVYLAPGVRYAFTYRFMSDWWALLTLAAAVGAVVGASLGRRHLTIIASFVLLVLLAWDAISLLVDNSRGQWSVNIGMGEVGVFAMWLPVALLLVICAEAVRGAGETRRRDKAWIICVPVAVSMLTGAVSLLTAAAEWQSPLPALLLGMVLIYAPLAIVALTILWGAIRKDPVTKAAAGLLMAASSLPVLWLLAFVAPYPWWAPETLVPLVYYGPGLLVACVIIRFLIRNRARIPSSGR